VDVIRQGQKRAHRNVCQTTRSRHQIFGRWREGGGCTGDRALPPVRQPDDDQRWPSSGASFAHRKAAAIQRMMRVNDPDLSDSPVKRCGAYKCPAIRPTPTPSWTGSFITLIGSNSPAKACDGPETGKPKRLDHTPFLSNIKSRKPASLATRAASFRYGGRHHSGIPGGFMSFYPGGFVVIGRPAVGTTLGGDRGEAHELQRHHHQRGRPPR